MEKIYDLKLARAIGVSNANAEQLERVQKNARVPIHDNQVECHLHLNQKDLKVNKDLEYKNNLILKAILPILLFERKILIFLIIIPGGPEPSENLYDRLCTTGQPRTYGHSTARRTVSLFSINSRTNVYFVSHSAVSSSPRRIPTRWRIQS
jgi:hypothetical protein